MNELINGRTPDEIKRNLSYLVRCEICPQNHEYGCDYEKRTTECQTVDDALALIQNLEAQQPKWISVEERLPERYTPVLILVKRMPDNPNSSYICLIGVYEGDYWMKDSGHYYDDIDGEAVYWMPLPELPKEDAHE
jgi:hypothetical protein